MDRDIEAEIDVLKLMYANLYEITKRIIDENVRMAQLMVHINEVACGRGYGADKLIELIKKEKYAN